MKILLLTPGTGNFHCGSCLRDEALVRGLRKLGHDAAINALYLPLVLDDKAGIDGDHVSMGGIGMYLQTKSALLRHAPAPLIRLLDHPVLLRRVASRADMTSPAELGRMTCEMLRGTHGKTAQQIKQLIRHLRADGTPDIVLLNNALLLGLAKPIREALGCAVACTLQGEDTFIDGLPAPYRDEAWQQLHDCAQYVDRFLPVSVYHRKIMHDRLAIHDNKLHVAYNGIELEGFALQTETPDPPVIGYLARLCETKGLGQLIDAIMLMQRSALLGNARVHLIGAATPSDQAYCDKQVRRLEEAGLGERVTVSPNISRAEKIAALRGMSLLSVPATYGESFGLYVLEANAAGVPCVEPDHAGLAEVIGLTGGGILYEPGNASSHAEALADLLSNEPRRRELGVKGRQAVLDRFTAAHMAEHVVTALEPLCPAHSP